MVAFTGAGISTACGIPDFRGPSGIWTLQRAGQPLPRPKVSFTHAKPSLTHQVLVGLMSAGKLDYLVSQNVDGLHLRSGIPRAALAELHGNCFCERCPGCGAEYIRDFEVETVGFKRTGRRCTQVKSRRWGAVGMGCSSWLWPAAAQATLLPCCSTRPPTLLPCCSTRPPTLLPCCSTRSPLPLTGGVQHSATGPHPGLGGCAPA